MNGPTCVKCTPVLPSMWDILYIISDDSPMLGHALSDSESEASQFCNIQIQFLPSLECCQYHNRETRDRFSTNNFTLPL